MTQFVWRARSSRARWLNNIATVSNRKRSRRRAGGHEDGMRRALYAAGEMTIESIRYSIFTSRPRERADSNMTRKKNTAAMK